MARHHTGSTQAKSACLSQRMQLRFLVLLFSSIKHILWVLSTFMFFMLLKQFQNFVFVCFAFCVIQRVLTVTKTLRECSSMTKYHLCFTLNSKHLS